MMCEERKQWLEDGEKGFGSSRVDVLVGTPQKLHVLFRTPLCVVVAVVIAKWWSPLWSYFSDVSAAEWAR